MISIILAISSVTLLSISNINKFNNGVRLLLQGGSVVILMLSFILSIGFSSYYAFMTGIAALLFTASSVLVDAYNRNSKSNLIMYMVVILAICSYSVLAYMYSNENDRLQILSDKPYIEEVRKQNILLDSLTKEEKRITDSLDIKILEYNNILKKLEQTKQDSTYEQAKDFLEKIIGRR